MMRSTLAVLMLLSALPALCSTKDRSGLFFNYITPLALGISSCSVVVLVVAVVVSCYFDNKGRSGLPKSVQQFPSRIWIPRAKQIRDEIEQLSEEPVLSKSRSKSEEEPTTAIQIGDIEEEARHFRPVSRSRQVSSRMDPTEKHNLIIEAIYQASGRDLPEEYKTKGGAANVHGIRSLVQELKNAPLEAIKEVDESATTQRTLTELTEKRPKSKSAVGKRGDSDMTEDKTISGEENESKKQTEEKKAKETVVEVKKNTETVIEGKKDEMKRNAVEEPKEDKKKEEENRKVSNKEQILTMEEIKEDQKKVEAERKEELKRSAEGKAPETAKKPEDKSEKTEEKSEKTEDAITSTKEATPKKADDQKEERKPQQQ